MGEIEFECGVSLEKVPARKHSGTVFTTENARRKVSRGVKAPVVSRRDLVQREDFDLHLLPHGPGGIYFETEKNQDKVKAGRRKVKKRHMGVE